jgi:hypothetical protein
VIVRRRRRRGGGTEIHAEWTVGRELVLYIIIITTFLHEESIISSFSKQKERHSSRAEDGRRGGMSPETKAVQDLSAQSMGMHPNDSGRGGGGGFGFSSMSRRVKSSNYTVLSPCP